MSIFDSVIGDTQSFSDALLSVGEGAVSSATSTSSDSAANSEYRALRLQNMLDRGQMSNPYQQGREFTASKSKPTEQVDSENINQQWLQRLNRYSSIPQVQGARAKT